VEICDEKKRKMGCEKRYWMREKSKEKRSIGAKWEFEQQWSLLEGGGSRRQGLRKRERVGFRGRGTRRWRSDGDNH